MAAALLSGALALAAASPAAAAGPPDAPATPTVRPESRSVILSWVAPNDEGTTITGYKVSTYLTNSNTPLFITDFVGDPSTTQTVGNQLNGVPYRYKVAAVSGAGTGALSPYSATVTPQAWLPFSSYNAFIVRQFHDFAGRAPTSAEQSNWTADLGGGTKTQAQLIDGLRTATYYEPTIAPVIRLYMAYFLRIPDTGGIVYWIGRIRAGVHLAAVSDTFAHSHEFLTKYGMLTNKQYVDLLYQNVLGRAPDAGGEAHWIAALDGGMTRGAVMLAFSESSEYTRTRAKEVTVVDTFLGLLRRTPTAAEAANDISRLVGGTPITTIITEILTSTAYQV